MSDWAASSYRDRVRHRTQRDRGRHPGRLELRWNGCAGRRSTRWTKEYLAALDRRRRTAPVIPVNVVTGFLGSGKTTLLREALQHPAMSDSAVIVNEFGEIGLDHLLLEEIEEGVLLHGERLRLLHHPLRSEVRHSRPPGPGRPRRDSRPSGALSWSRPPVLRTRRPSSRPLLAEPVHPQPFPDSAIIVCTVDALNGSGQLDRQPESVKQALVADRILITKCDLADEGGIRALSDRLAGLNPAAVQTRGCGSGFDIQALFSRDVGDEEHRLEEVRRWIAEPEPRNNGAVHAHGSGIHSFCLTWPDPMEWTVFGIWLTALLHAHGENVLRVKGILNARDSLTPVVVHGVQHVMHPPLHLERWPDRDRSSRIVFITRDLPASRLKASLAAFLEAAAGATTAH